MGLKGLETASDSRGLAKIAKMYNI